MANFLHCNRCGCGYSMAIAKVGDTCGDETQFFPLEMSCPGTLQVIATKRVAALQEVTATLELCIKNLRSAEELEERVSNLEGKMVRH